MKKQQIQTLTQNIFAATICTLVFVSCSNATDMRSDLQKSNTLDTSTVASKVSKGNFANKMINQLPEWTADRYYMLNDNRIVDEDEVKYIGGYDSKRGEVFFLDGTEIVFTNSQVKLHAVNGLNTKTMNSGDYQIQIVWDDDMTAGDYSEGRITLYFQKIEKFHGPLLIMGWK